MSGENWFSFTFDLFFRIVSFVKGAYDFLTYDIEILGIEISVLGILGGVGITAVLSAVIVKALTPLF